MAEIEMLAVPGWAQISWLRHGFSTRAGGVTTVYGGKSLNLGWTKEDDPAAVAENRRLMVQKMAPSMRLVTVRQVHGNHVEMVKAENALAGRLETLEGKAVLEGDGLVTNAPGVLLATGTADCVPVLIVDPVRRAVGAFHAGWRGTVARIVEKGVETMRREYGSRAGDLKAAIGPSIGPCCYTVGDEVWKRFTEGFPYGAELFHKMDVEGGAPALRVDLWEANRRQLLEAGLPEESITVLGECTACTLDASGEPKYFSHRAQAGRTGRMLNVIGIAEDEQPGR